MSWVLHNEYLPTTAFGACFKCRSSRRPGERVLDPNLLTNDLPPELTLGHQDGYVMFCESCIGEAAGLLGWVSPAEAASRSEQLAGLVDRAREATARAEAAEQALEALRSYDAARHPVYVGDVVPPAPGLTPNSKALTSTNMTKSRAR